MWVNTCIGMWVALCIALCINMCTDMCIDMCMALVLVVDEQFCDFEVAILSRREERWIQSAVQVDICLAVIL